MEKNLKSDTTSNSYLTLASKNAEPYLGNLYWTTAQPESNTSLQIWFCILLSHRQITNNISMAYLDLFWYPIPHFSTWHLVQSDQGDILQSCGHGSKHISSINTATDWIKYRKMIKREGSLYEWPANVKRQLMHLKWIEWVQQWI